MATKRLDNAELLAALDRHGDRLATSEKEKHDWKVFERLFSQFLVEPAKIDWNSWKLPGNEWYFDSETLADIDCEKSRKALLDRLAVVRLNGGLGTTMGCAGPKSLITVKNGKSFLQIALDQIELLNQRHDTRVPLLIMDSFNTHAETNVALEKLLKGVKLTPVTQFEQAKCPRIFDDTLLPVPEKQDDAEAWYPPGHGNIFDTLLHTGLADELLAQGRDVLFVSNIDNTGAIVDTRFIQALVTDGHEYMMEVTPKTVADIKGGTLIEVGPQRLMHLEMPQVPDEGLDTFCSNETFKIFNTNNIWLNLAAIRPKLHEIRSEIIENKKALADGKKVIQLETSIGGAICNFPNARALVVKRNRFLPVKRTQDLLLIASDVFELDEQKNTITQAIPKLPVVNLSSEFSKLDDFYARFKSIPSLKNATEFSVSGNVNFGENVLIRGSVKISGDKEEVVIPDGSILSS